MEENFSKMSLNREFNHENKQSLYYILSNIWGFVPLKILSFMIKSGFWDYVYKEISVSKNECCEYFGWKERPINRILDLLVNLEMISIHHDNINLTPLAKKWLVSDSKNYLGKFVLRANELQKAYDNLDNLLMTDEPDSIMHNSTLDSFGRNSNITEDFTKSMDSMTIEFVEEIASKFNFKPKHKILDMGAGLGTISCFLSNQFPHLDITAVDLPGVTKYSKNYIEKHAIKPDKIKIVTSDWRSLKHSNNDLYDTIILSQILHEEKKEDSSNLIKLCSELLCENGHLIIIGFIDSSGFYSLISNIFSMNMLFELGSDNIKKEEITELANAYDIFYQSDYYLSGGRLIWIGEKRTITRGVTNLG
jgi:2-polyprenyl-3-methyl-5-hydroxy-6-metoxy-1,4-benzoquinol methylase